MFGAPAPGQAQSREEERGGHDLDEMAAGNGIGKFVCAFGEFTAEPFFEFGGVGEVVNAAPITS